MAATRSSNGKNRTSQSAFTRQDGETLPVSISISAPDYARLREHLFHDVRKEQHAFLLAGICRTAVETRLLVRDMLFAGPGDLAHQRSAYLRLNPAYFLPVFDRCRAEGLHLVEVHSHPFAKDAVTFSHVDTANEWEKLEWYGEKLPWMMPATLVFGQNSLDGHWYDAAVRQLRPLSGVRVIGDGIHLLRPTSASAPTVAYEQLEDEIYHRQALAFGTAGQALIGTARIAIVGCGGLGSVLAQQLAFLGVHHFVLVDHDRVETTNLNRLVFARPEDAAVGRLKVEVVSRGIHEVNPTAFVQAVPGSIADPEIQQCVKDVDLLLAGTDNHGARLVLNRLATRYLIPYMDLGTGIHLEEGEITAAGGQIFFARPGGPCLECIGLINPDQAQLDLMNAEERGRHTARGYGLGIPQPAVAFLNAALASFAAGEVVKWLTGYRQTQAMIRLDMLAPSAQAIVVPKPNPRCPACHHSAFYAQGDEHSSAAWEMPVPEGWLEPNGESVSAG